MNIHEAHARCVLAYLADDFSKRRFHTDAEWHADVFKAAYAVAGLLALTGWDCR